MEGFVLNRVGILGLSLTDSEKGLSGPGFDLKTHL